MCEHGARILQIEIMGAFFGVSLNLLRSGIRGKLICLAGVFANEGVCVRGGPHVAKADNE